MPDLGGPRSVQEKSHVRPEKSSSVVDSGSLTPLESPQSSGAYAPLGFCRAIFHSCDPWDVSGPRSLTGLPDMTPRLPDSVHWEWTPQPQKMSSQAWHESSRGLSMGPPRSGIFPSVVLSCSGLLHLRFYLSTLGPWVRVQLVRTAHAVRIGQTVWVAFCV